MNNPAISSRARGFASMDAKKQREIASRGGRAAHAHGTAHKFSPEEARLAGRKGGEAVSGNREHMAKIGRRGGEARHARRIARNQAAQRSEQTTPANPQQIPAEPSRNASDTNETGQTSDEE
jgi:general stress protein YciG